MLFLLLLLIKTCLGKVKTWVTNVQLQSAQIISSFFRFETLKKEKKNDKNKGFLLVDENVCEKALGNLEEPQEKNKKKVIL